MSPFSPTKCNSNNAGSHHNNDHLKPPIVTTAVAVNKGKSSVYAVRWAIDNLGTSNRNITLIHVARTHHHDDAAQTMSENDIGELFASFHGYSARKGMTLNEVVLEDNDVAKALLEYVSNNYITNMVIGASSRNALSKFRYFIRKLKNHNIPDTLMRSVPDFCNVYVISKWKVAAMKRAGRTIVNTAVPPRSMSAPASSLDHHHTDADASIRGASLRPLRKLSLGSSEPPLTLTDSPQWGHFSMENHDHIATNGLMTLSSDGSPSQQTAISDLSGPSDFGSLDVADGSYDFSIIMSPKHVAHHSPSHNLEAEMRRLKLELKQTINLYSNACKEALSAKKKAELLAHMKIEEERRFEEARQAEQAALARAEMEKTKCRAAIDAAEKAQKIAQKESLRRKYAELKAKHEADEKEKALNVLHQNDHRYRRYNIKEIEEGTNNFATENKIGEGGYGPVFKGILDYTPVAIKILRPDANQGRKQFHQEVEVLCNMRHPNMVLLLGACPEYGCLVYEYMDFGSLDDRLFHKGNCPPIPWKDRFRIAFEIATALLFLHQAKPEPLVHRDLKPANILLDRTYKSKISDVGLARLVPPSVADSVTQYHLTCAAGTFNYIDPEYQQTGKLTPKSDIYSLGIMLLQILTAKPPGGLIHQVRVAIENGKFEEVLDPEITDWPIEEALCFVKIALQCAELSKKDRPDLGGVVVPELHRLTDFGRECGQVSGSSYSNSTTQTSLGLASSTPTSGSDTEENSASIETENSGSVG